MIVQYMLLLLCINSEASAFDTKSICENFEKKISIINGPEIEKAQEIFDDFKNKYNVNCDDGGPAEMLSLIAVDSVGISRNRFMKTLGLIKGGIVNETFILRHLDAIGEKQSLSNAIEFSKNSCPAGYKIYCSKIITKCTAALKQQKEWAGN